MGKNNPDSPWPEKDEELCRLWLWRDDKGERHSADEIAVLMGVSSKNAVLGRVHRLKLPAREATIRKYPEARSRNERRKAAKERQREMMDMMMSLRQSATEFRTRPVHVDNRPKPVPQMPREVFTVPAAVVARPVSPIRDIPSVPIVRAHAPSVRIAVPNYLPEVPLDTLAAVSADRSYVMAWGAARGCYDVGTINRKRMALGLAPFKIDEPPMVRRIRAAAIAAE